MHITRTLYVPTREAWRDWLAAHHEDQPEVWLVSYRKHTGRPSVAYHEAVEEALCFGWIERIRATYVDHARKQPAEFEKRLNHLVEKSARGEQFGYGIEDYF